MRDEKVDLRRAAASCVPVPTALVVMDTWAMTTEEVGEMFLHVIACWTAGTVGDCCPAWAREEWERAVAKNFHGMCKGLDGEHDYGSEWPSIRANVLARDVVCRGCGFDGHLDVHHRIPFRMFEDRDEANALSNLVALCRACHATADHRYRQAGAVFGEAI